MVLCVVLICKEGIVVMVFDFVDFIKYERSRGHLFVLSWASV